MKNPIMILGITTLLFSGFSKAQGRLFVASCEELQQKIEKHANVILRKKHKTNFNNLTLSGKAQQTEILSYVLVVGFDMSAKRAGVAANNLCKRNSIVYQPK
ncbi:hypothetical protein [Paraglaciecola sp.]|uniref:hypothetical protein n=1 Tax=Paraglaciecola sp. TaxID=1920173 RepID=UPI003EF84182